MINFITSINHVAILFFILRSITGEVIFLYVGLIIGLVVFSFQFFTYRTNLNILIYITLFLLGSFISLISDFDNYLLFLPHGISCLGVAWRIHTHGINNKFVTTLLFLIFSYFILMLYILNGADDIFANSRNHVSVMFINLTVIYIISRSLIGKSYNSIPAYFSLYASYIGIGLTGIISSAILVLMKILDFINQKISYFAYFLLIAILIFFYFFFEQSLDLIEYILTFNQNADSDYSIKFTDLKSYSENPRFNIWNEYLSNLNFYKIIFGVSVSDCFAQICNLHSSYFLLHARTGIIAFLFILFFITTLIQLAKNNVKLAICFLAILIRGIGDTTFMAGSSFDFVIAYLLVFAPYLKKHI